MTDEFSQLLKTVCQGNESAWQILAVMFAEKKLSDAEQVEVFLYVKQAAKNNVYAMYVQAQLYDQGWGTRQDAEMAFIMLREAAVLGHSAATFEVGRRFLLGIGITQNYSNALQWLQRAAKSPHYYPAAMHHLGLMYEQGLGVEQDASLAQAWKEKALAKGYRP